MTIEFQRTSAQIFQFPAGGRAGSRAPRGGAAAGVPATPRAEPVVFDSWYHDAAIQEETERGRNPQRR